MTRWTDIHLEVRTPLFGGDGKEAGAGDIYDTTSPIRVPSVRGALRYWLRAVAAGHGITDLSELRAEEAKVFGSAEHPGPIALRIDRQPAMTPPGDQPRWAALNEDRFAGATYLLGQGLWRYGPRGNSATIRPHVPPGSPVTLRIAFSRDPNIDGPFMTALWAWLAYGGLGSRVRRGFGQLGCTGVEGAPLPVGWTASLLRYPSTCEQWKFAGTEAIPERIRAVAPRGWPALRAGLPPDGTPVPDFPALCPQWWEGGVILEDDVSLAKVLHSAGKRWRMFRVGDGRGLNGTPQQNMHSPEWVDSIHGNSREYQVAALGLPVNYYSRGFAATINARIGGVSARRASPVWLRPVCDDDGRWHLFSHVFFSRLLPDGAQVVGQRPTEQFDTPTFPDAEVVWEAWLAGEPRP